MNYYEVLPADGHYHGDSALTYSYEDSLPLLSVVTVPLRQRLITGFVVSLVNKPSFNVKPIKSIVSKQPLPEHCLKLAEWMRQYYSSTLAESLRQFAPTKPSIKRKLDTPTIAPVEIQLEWESPLTPDQKEAIEAINANPSTTVLLHGETGTGKTRVYLELARQTLASGRSVMILTPEISLTSQLAFAAKKYLDGPVFVLHSQLGGAERKKIWFKILEAKEPIVIIGARSGLFSPINSLGLIVLDEAHEPAYKQEQSPRYHAIRVASQLGSITGAKVILGTATPPVADYYLAQARGAIVEMTKLATGNPAKVTTEIVDMKDRASFTKSPYLSNQLIDAINTTIRDKRQVLIYLNRRGSARQVLCSKCGWRFLCPNCDIPLVYHGDEHLVRCHTCGWRKTPPTACPECSNPEIIYKTIGTKALVDEVVRLFANQRVKRFDSDNLNGERINEQYEHVLSGEVDILVGTQLLAKGLDLPRLGLVGIVSAEASLSLPDYTAEERSFQLLYQVIGRVGRGHGKGLVVIQSYDPESIIIRSAANRDWQSFYKQSLAERQQFRFPPFSYLLQLVCRRTSPERADETASKLRVGLLDKGLPVEIIGPAPSFYLKRGNYYYYQLVIKSKDRKHLVELAKYVPADWQVNLDPVDLL